MKSFFSGSTLKVIAVFAMLVDHIGQVVLKNGIALKASYAMFTDEQFSILLNVIDVFHMIGRLAFPIFCFLLVEGFMHTHNLRRYFLNLLIFAVISEPIYDLANSGVLFSIEQQNVIFTLLLGLIAIYFIKKSWHNPLFAAVIILAASAFSYVCKLDGSYYGIGLISIFYLCCENLILRDILTVIFMFVCGLDFTVNGLDGYFMMSVISVILISMYNGKRGMKMKYFFYVFYPAHFLVLYLVSVGIGGFLG